MTEAAPDDNQPKRRSWTVPVVAALHLLPTCALFGILFSGVRQFRDAFTDFNMELSVGSIRMIQLSDLVVAQPLLAVGCVFCLLLMDLALLYLVTNRAVRLLWGVLLMGLPLMVVIVGGFVLLRDLGGGLKELD